ncbi:nucleotide exchange factor GrpE [Catellatospora tritici]|uniref:nucleotide exchange factor GrpE n=1 Tax=Catellatospora tritici TaxID=2851566 RepID=UPI001C2D87CA|nr:nucleotide exchange factor GrpE [Catellatospora tritici]MBV1852687.1 nucleotide exchange factor GrpE [Catellatospora tritici]
MFGRGRPGRDGHDREVHDLARTVASYGARLVGQAVPDEHMSVKGLLRVAMTSMSMLAEGNAYIAREGDLARLELERGLTDAQRSRLGLAKELVVIDERVRAVRDAVDQDAEIEARNFIRWLAERLNGVMSLAGVTTFEDDGQFDPATHEVAHTVPTTDERRIGEIAHSVRPGLRLDGSLLQPQLVVLYTAPAAE